MTAGILKKNVDQEHCVKHEDINDTLRIQMAKKCHIESSFCSVLGFFSGDRMTSTRVEVRLCTSQDRL